MAENRSSIGLVQGAVANSCTPKGVQGLVANHELPCCLNWIGHLAQGRQAAVPQKRSQRATGRWTLRHAPLGGAQYS